MALTRGRSTGAAVTLTGGASIRVQESLGDVLRAIQNVSVPSSGVVLIALTKVDGMPVHLAINHIVKVEEPT